MPSVIDEKGDKIQMARGRRERGNGEEDGGPAARKQGEVTVEVSRWIWKAEGEARMRSCHGSE